MRLPPFAGIVTAIESQRDGLRVQPATAILHRLAYVKQRLAIAAAAFLPSTPEWEAKGAFALHGWIDADHAAALYSRIGELREPCPDPSDIPADDLRDAFDEVLAAATTPARLGALYGGIRPLMREAIERYLDATNPLCDQPSVRVLRGILAEEVEITEWATAASDALTASDEAKEWRRHLEACIAACGGLDGALPAGAFPPRRFHGPYDFDVTPARDSRFDNIFDPSTPADVVYLDERRPADEVGRAS